MKVLRVIVLVAVVLSTCTAAPSSLVEIVDAFGVAAKTFSDNVIIKMPDKNNWGTIKVQGSHINLTLRTTQDNQVFNETSEKVTTRTAPSTGLTRDTSISVKPNLPLPIIPSHSVALAFFNTPMHQMLGLMPTNESLSSDLLWIDFVQAPEWTHLVWALQAGRPLPLNFRPLVVILKTDPLPVNAQILNYSFPPLAVSGGFLSPSNANLVAVPFNVQFLSSYLLCLGFLPNRIFPVPDLRSGQPPLGVPMLQPIHMKPLPSGVTQSVAGETFNNQKHDQAELTPQPVRSQSVTVPSGNVPASHTAQVPEVNLIELLQQLGRKYPSLKLNNIENFQARICFRGDSQRSSVPEFIIGLLPKSALVYYDKRNQIPPPQSIIVSDYDSMLATGFEAHSFPSYFLPLNVAWASSSHISTSNGERHIPLIVRESSTFVFPRDPCQLTGPFVCVTEKRQTDHFSGSNSKVSSDPDTPDNPAIQPRLFNNTARPMAKIVPTTPTTTNSSTTVEPAVSTTLKGIERFQSSTSSSIPKSTSKPFPSKKSWKHPFFEPSVKVIKRSHSNFWGDFRRKNK